MKAIGFQAGQIGDVYIGTVAARAFKLRYPNSHLVCGIARKYQFIAPLLEQNKYFDSVHIWEEYDKWPGLADIAHMQEAKYDHVFNAMAPHWDDRWWTVRHQAAEIACVHGLRVPDDLQLSLTPPANIPDNKGYIGLQYIGGFQDWPNRKSFTVERANQVVAAIKALGYKVLVFGAPEEPPLEGAEKVNAPYVDSIRNMLGCKALVTVDSGICWAASADSMPTLGLYSNGYYGAQYAKNIQPINPNARYLDADLVVNLPIEQIIAALKEVIA